MFKIYFLQFNHMENSKFGEGVRFEKQTFSIHFISLNFFHHSISTSSYQTHANQKEKRKSYIVEVEVEKLTL